MSEVVDRKAEFGIDDIPGLPGGDRSGFVPLGYDVKGPGIQPSPGSCARTVADVRSRANTDFRRTRGL